MTTTTQAIAPADGAILDSAAAILTRTGNVQSAAILTRARKFAADDIFRVLVLGGYAAGKTSVIDALCGDRLLSEGIAAHTLLVTRVRRGASPEIQIVPADDIDAPDPLPDEKLREYREFAPVLGSTMSGRFAIEVRRPFALLEGSVELIEAPSFDDSAAARRRCLDLAAEADLVLFVMNSGQLAGRNELDFANELLPAVSNLAFVCSKYDFVDEEERDELKEYACSRLSTLATAGARGVLFVSAKQPSASTGIDLLADLIRQAIADSAPNAKQLRLKRAGMSLIGSAIQSVQIRQSENHPAPVPEYALQERARIDERFDFLARRVDTSTNDARELLTDMARETAIAWSLEIPALVATFAAQPNAEARLKTELMPWLGRQLAPKLDQWYAEKARPRLEKVIADLDVDIAAEDEARLNAILGGLLTMDTPTAGDLPEARPNTKANVGAGAAAIVGVGCLLFPPARLIGCLALVAASICLIRPHLNGSRGVDANVMQWAMDSVKDGVPHAIVPEMMLRLDGVHAAAVDVVEKAHAAEIALLETPSSAVTAGQPVQDDALAELERIAKQIETSFA